ncbi:MAG TPA: tetratricopeptide repeat protein [Gemmataceae bacterium]|nr:tetratricopeptide repeat protein [Gemmataceae bacterium]
MKKTSVHPRAASTRKARQENAATMAGKKATPDGITLEGNGTAIKALGRHAPKANGAAMTALATESTPPLQATGQQQYEKALKLARHADRVGGPLPVELLHQAAATGYAPAQYALATWHLFGKGVRKSYKKAAVLLKQAARQDFALAEFDLAVSYELGKGLPKSEPKARHFYLKAATHGDLQAQVETARCYFWGVGTAKNLVKAYQWYKKAAGKGHTEAQYCVALAYEHGDGVEQDIQKALEWYKRAASGGDFDAKRALKRLQARVG